jgi:hypothetical protein
MIRSFSARPRFVLVVAVLTLAVLGGATLGSRNAAADPWWDDAAVAPAPSLADVSTITQTPALFTVTGTGFTPGGAVYLAVYDQMGARLYETRWITAGAAVYGANGSADPAAGFRPGGDLREAFADLCGANAMMRALDQRTATWSNWLQIDATGIGAARYGANGSADPAAGFVPGC